MHEVSLDSEKLGSVVCDHRLRWESHLFKLLRVWCWNLSTGDSNGWRLEVVKGVFRDERNELCANTEAWETGLYGHEVAGLLYGLDDGLNVHWLDTPEVDDFGVDAILALQLLGGHKRLAYASRKGDDCEVLAGALDLRFAELERVLVREMRLAGRFGMPYRNDEVVLLYLLADLERQTVEQLVLQHTDWVRVANGGL